MRRELDPTDLKPLETLAEWNKDFPAHIMARVALEREIRPITNFVQGYTKTTDADRATIRITVRGTSKTSAPPLNWPGQGGSDIYKFLSVSSRGNLQKDFPSAQAGKTAYYALRWVSTRGKGAVVGGVRGDGGGVAFTLRRDTMA